MDQVKLERYCGDTFRFVVALKDSEGNPIPLAEIEDDEVVEGTEATVRFTLSLSTAIDQDTEGVAVDVDHAAGRIDIVVNYDLMAVAPGEYPFDVEVTWDDGIRRTIVLGKLTLFDDVTKPEAPDE